MNKLLIVGAALVALIGTPALAADMAVPVAPLYKAPPPPPPPLWTGFYIGLNGGGTWARDHLTAAPADAGTTAFFGPCFAAGACPRDYGNGSTGSGGEFGGQAGFNWQFTNFLVGIETDAQWTRASSTSGVALTNAGLGFVPFAGAASSQLQWFGTTRGRLGFLPTPTWLVYGTGGVAYGSIARSWSGGFPSLAEVSSGSSTQTTVGWAAGAGTEWMFMPNWTLGVEYLYIKFESNTFGANGLASAGCTAANCNFNVTSNGLSANVARLKVNFKF